MSNKAKAILAKFETVLDSTPSPASAWDVIDDTCQAPKSRKASKMAYEAQASTIATEGGRFVDLNV